MYSRLLAVCPWRVLLALSLIVNHPASADQPLVVTHIEPQDQSVPALHYEHDVLSMAMEATEIDWGPYEIKTVPFVSRARAARDLVDNRYSNFVQVFGYSNNNAELMKLAHVPFPVFLGVLGFRVCFASSLVEGDLAQSANLQSLRQYKVGQGKGWSDVAVLRANGFVVVEVGSKERLIRMTAANEVQLYCRGVNEVKAEYEKFRHTQGLKLDQSFALYYPHPRFFFTHPDNAAVRERLSEGLRRIYASGRLVALFMEVFGESLTFVKLDQRNLFVLRSPQIDGLNFSFEQFSFMPLERQPDSNELFKAHN